MADHADSTRSNRSVPLAWLALFAVLALGGVARFYQLGDVPFGLYPDEALNGTQAREALATETYRWFYAENHGREGLFLNLAAQAIRVFGPTPFALRSIAALAGTLLILGIYLLGRELSSTRVGLIAAFLVAGSFWAVNFSRVAFRGVLLPTVLAFCFFALLRAIRTRRVVWFAVAGALFGSLLHTYTAARVAPLVLLGAVPIWLAARPRAWIADKAGVGAFLLAASIVAAPLLVHFAQRPDDAMSRVNEVSVFASDGSAASGIVNGIRLGLMKYFWAGDLRWRHNYPPYAILHPVVSIAFAAGLALVLLRAFRDRGRRRWTHAFLGIWFGAMLIPEVLTTEGLPHALRAIGTLPAVYLIAAVAVDALLARVATLSSAARRIAVVACAVALLAVPVTNGIKYFGYWASHEGTLNDYCAHWRMLAEDLRARPDRVNKYVILNAGGSIAEGDWPLAGHSIRYFTDGRTANLHYVTGNVRMIAPCAIGVLLPKPEMMQSLARVFPTGRWKRLAFRPDRECYAFVMEVD